MLSITEVGLYLGCSDQHVRDMVEAGRLMAFSINDDATTVRQARRVNRFSLEGWFLHQFRQQSEVIPFTINPDAKWWADQLAKRPDFKS